MAFPAYIPKFINFADFLEIFLEILSFFFGWRNEPTHITSRNMVSVCIDLPLILPVE